MNMFFCFVLFCFILLLLQKSQLKFCVLPLKVKIRLALRGG